MLIENDIHLDFDDVLIRPKRTPLESRKQVSLEREFTFLHSGETWSGIPIIASNMDTVGTFEMANSLMEYNMMTAIHKFYDFKSWVDFAENTNKIKMEKLVSPTIGMNDISNYHSIIE